MGNTPSSLDNFNYEKNTRHTRSGSKILFFLHKTWTVIIAEKWTQSKRWNDSERTDQISDVSSIFESQFSKYSLCSCAQCQKEDIDAFSCCDSDFFESISMAPNSETACRLGKYQFIEETFSKEQRAPIYNPEDYALSLRKWGRKSPNGNQVSLYVNPANPDLEIGRTQCNTFRDYRNPMLNSSGSEMTLRQFSSVSELLNKLKADLRLAYPSFIQEFVADPFDGVTLLMDLLRAVQLSQSNSPQAIPGSSHTTGRVPPAVQRRALLDELSCLQCLMTCCTRYGEATRKLIVSSAGLFTLAICIMSNVNKSRIIALQLLTKACEPIINGNSAVSEALSTLRLRFGEPVRFRFLVGMLNSAGGQGKLLLSGMRFLNTFLETCGSLQKRLYIQAELEQAGFDLVNIKKNIGSNAEATEKIFEELDTWEKNHVDVESLLLRVQNSDKENDGLRDKILLLERKVQILQEEKGILVNLEQCLKDKCSELQGEVKSLKSDKPRRSVRDDEGISSSELSTTPEDHFKSQIIPIKPPRNIEPYEEETETTIEEVIEELKNIINDQESEHYKEENRKLKETKLLQEQQAKIKMQIKNITMDDSSIDKEIEIIPSIIMPQPPRKTRSLVQMFVPAEDFEYGTNNKELFFENETMYSDGSSDSLLSASKYILKNQNHKKSRHTNRELISSTNTRTKSKSLDRIDDGLESIVDIIVTDHKMNKKSPSNHAKSDSGNVSGASLTHSISQVIICNTPVKSSYDLKNHHEAKTPHDLKINHDSKTPHDIRSPQEYTEFFTHQKSYLPQNPQMYVTQNPLNAPQKSPPKAATRPSLQNIVKIHQNSSNCPQSGPQLTSPLASLKNGSTDDASKQRMFLPVFEGKRDDFEVPYYFPRIHEKKNSTSSSNAAVNNNFMIKRGHLNAGLYSGQNKVDNSVSMSNVTCKSIEYFSMGTYGSKNKSLEKVTDFPSGLY